MTKPVEVMIRDVIYDAAMLRAKTQAQQLRTVAGLILFNRAAEAEPVPGTVRPSARVLGQPPRTRLRFRIDEKSYAAARQRLHASGVSVTAAIEEGLQRYALTGQFK